MDEDEAWVQQSIVGEPLLDLVLRLSNRATMNSMATALRAWLMTPPADRPCVVGVQ